MQRIQDIPNIAKKTPSKENLEAVKKLRDCYFDYLKNRKNFTSSQRLEINELLSNTKNYVEYAFQVMGIEEFDKYRKDMKRLKERDGMGKELSESLEIEQRFVRDYQKKAQEMNREEVPVNEKLSELKKLDTELLGNLKKLSSDNIARIQVCRNLAYDVYRTGLELNWKGRF